MPTTQTYTGTLVAISCSDCGITFGMPEPMYEARIKDRRKWWCPNGHCRHFIGETEEQKLRRQLRVSQSYATHERDQREATERSNRALKGVITKTKRRVGNGVCPCCTRTFRNLAEHMAGKHPDYAGQVTS